MYNEKYILINQLKFFIEPHPNFFGTEEEIFTPKKGLGIKFWCEGGFEIEGRHNKIEINFNSVDTGLLVFALRTNRKERIIRIPIEKVIAIELLPNKNIDSGLSDLLRLGNEKKN
jgi:hypothetical protein